MLYKTNNVGKLKAIFKVLLQVNRHCSQENSYLSSIPVFVHLLNGTLNAYKIKGCFCMQPELTIGM